MKKARCPECGMTDTRKYGIHTNRSGKKQKYHCNECGRNWARPLKTK